MEVRWSETQPIDLLALVPARRYDARGLDAKYGLPDTFTVELIDADGKTLALVASEQNARSHPVRHGHPFVYPISPPVAAAGIRVTARDLAPGSEGEDGHIHAWAEWFAFAGDRNLAYGGKVSATGGSTSSAPWQWNAAFLVDGYTPLGLPEIPAAGHRNVGWLSHGRADAGESASLTIDLGAVAPIDGLRLLPARRPTSDLPNGFGFPRRLEIAVADTPNPPTDPAAWRVVATLNLRNPGHNPVWIALDEATPARHVRVTAAELWKQFESYPAFFALSELEVFSGNENLALGKAVRSADGMPNLIAPGGRYWSSSALIDGHGPDGRLVPAREWMTLLDRRLAIEAHIHQLHLDAANVIRDWRNGALVLFALLGVAGLVALVALPLRFRIHSRRQLIAVRERIAGDLHDEVGSNLGSIQMYADLAEGRTGASEELKRIQRIAAETVSAVRDIVWLLRPGRDHRIGTVEHLRETASIMVESLDWHFHANEASWQVELSDEQNRNLFLFFREALHNILRHANASSVHIDVDTTERTLTLSIRDDGAGIPPEKIARPATLRALRQRAAALAAALDVATTPGHGVTLTLVIPLRKKSPRHSSP
jgi:signal transduction histidine kinase